MKRLLGTVLSIAAIAGANVSALASDSEAVVRPHREMWVSGGNYAVRADDFGCDTDLYNAGRRNFYVTRVSRTHSWCAFPNIFRGWQWGVGTKGRLPIRVDRAGMPRTWLSTRQKWRDKYNTAYDMWFSRYAQRAGQVCGAEVMVWLSHPGIRIGSWPVVHADGAVWNVMSWRAKGNGCSWNYVAFIRTRQTSVVRGLWLNPFFRYAESRRWLSRYWYWTSVAAGFELCSGGSGLGVNWFKVSLLK